jgi:2,4-dienoyl-CoA reductase-like NADH-dependent reductase (Old Yellow Enzyme family)
VATSATPPETDDAAVFFHPAEGDFNPTWAAAAFSHIEAGGYRCAGIVRDWDAAMAMIANRTAQVIVVARREHIHPEWLPRIEVAGETHRRAARDLGGPPRAESLADAPPPSTRGSRGAWAKGTRRPQLVSD